MNAGKKLTKIVTLTSLIALTLAGVREATRAHAHDSDDDRRIASYALGSTGLVAGQGLRTTLTNFGARRIIVQTRFIDADGAVVKQEPLTLEPGQMHTFAISRSELPRAEPAALLRIEVSAQRRDARDVLVTSAVIVWATGRISFPLKSVANSDRIDNFEIQPLSSQ
jgi:hypothetical protein